MISNIKDYNILEKPEGENSCDNNILLTYVCTKLPKTYKKLTQKAYLIGFSIKIIVGLCIKVIFF